MAMRNIDMTMPVFIKILICLLLGLGQSQTGADLGGPIRGPMILDRVGTPYLVKDDIIIEETGELTIRPGVELRFSPTTGITVFGRLVAEGTDNQRIIMTTAMGTREADFSTLEYATGASGTEFIGNNLPPPDPHPTNRWPEPRPGQGQGHGPGHGNVHGRRRPEQGMEDVEMGLPPLHPNERIRANGLRSLSLNMNMTELEPDVISVNGTVRSKRALNNVITNPPTVRLVEAFAPHTGRLQIYHRGHWRSVCSNSRNWTAPDLRTVCRELGFTGGEYYPWMDHLNDTKQLLWERPGCQGLERSLKECSNWAGRRVGAGGCDHHPNIAIRCDDYHVFPSRFEKNWRGIRFHDAKHRETYTNDNTLKIKESLSSLKYVDILFAGVGRDYNTSSAVESIGVPPLIQFIRVEYSAYNGINITAPGAVGSIRNSTVRGSGGYGIYVNSSSSGFLIDACRVESNTADGIHFVYHDMIPDRKLDLIDVFELCTFPITTNQVYPVRVSMEQFKTIAVKQECRKRFSVRPGYVLTVHFAYSMSQLDYGAEIRVYDGPDSRGTLLTTVRVKNETFPQSVTSTRETIYVEYNAKPSLNILAFLDVTAGKARDSELIISNSIITGNNGRGIAITNLRSNAIVTSSLISSNTHIAGIHVDGGVGHVNISRCEITSNLGDGVNMTSGGARNVSRSLITLNTGYGVAMWFNETSYKLPSEQDTAIEYSTISLNEGHSVFIGNYCLSAAMVNISGNLFQSGKKPVEIWSCWQELTVPNVKLLIGHNRFVGNVMGVKLNPLVNTNILLEHNFFTQNTLGCLLIEPVDKKELETLIVRGQISNNYFEHNSGLFTVAMGLSHSATKQSLLFTQNFVRYNRISDPIGLVPRSRVAAPVLISSANIAVFRNVLHNLESKYEIGSQMQDQSYELNCTFNWLGSNEEKEIYYRVFDRKDRFNLAKVKFIPFLLNPTDPNTEIVMTMELFVPQFDNSERIIGGEVTGRESLTTGEYKVIRDISVRPGGRLQISYGVTLKFLPSVGIMVGGQFHAEGFGHGDGEKVKFTLYETGRVNASDATVRLIGGKTRLEGRLQVRIDNNWGSVCNYEFNILAAAIACRQMGFVLNPTDWMMERFEIPQASPSEQVVMSNPQCTPWDSDITKCDAETTEDIENSCSHDNLVGIRCYDTSWAGIRLAMTADKGVMKYSVVEKAGLLDPHTNEHKPAIQLDFNHHVLSDIRVSDNTGDGLGIIYSDIHYQDEVNTVDRSEFSRNLGNGVLLRQMGLHMRDCLIEHNKLAGVLHDPAVLRPHQREMAGWISNAGFNKIEHLPMSQRDLWLDEGHFKYLITKMDPDVNEVYNIIAHDQNYIISMQLLNPIHNESSEEIWLYDRHDVPAKEGLNREYFKDLESWSVRRDQVTFPTVSSSYGVTLWFRSGQKPRGGCIILVRAIRSPVDKFQPRSDMLEATWPKIKIHNSKIRYNTQGIAVTNYNRYENEYGDIYLRKANETIEVLQCEISLNRLEPIYLFTPFREIYTSNISETTITINQTTIEGNGGGILQYSRDLRSSNNIFHWYLFDDTIIQNKDGGFQVSLPYVWQYNENFTHSVYFRNVTFRHNTNFEILTAGHFSKVKVLLSSFESNTCKHGLFTLSGMEKEIMIYQNRFVANTADYVVQFESDSQSEIVGQVQAYFVGNEVKMNRRIGHSHRVLSNVTYQPMSYAIGMKGIQKINVTNNLFGNELDYELLAGIRTAKLESGVNVVRNWWGTRDPKTIRDRIFDFDDWNSYSIATYRPYYLQDNFESPISTTFEEGNDVTINNLAGRLSQSLTLYSRYEPYIVRSDLTIMPNAELTIAPGVHIEFYPSVGILALGTLIAQGTPEYPIEMRPITIGKRQALDRLQRIQSNSVRLCAEEYCNRTNSGFLEYFNITTLQWVPICDHRFTERNAQVVCRELGFDTMNVYFEFDRRIEYYYESLSRIRSWAEAVECRGHEATLDSCQVRMNGQLYGYEYNCHWEDSFVFIHCGERNLERTMEYWGGIRFAPHDFEQHLFSSRMHDHVTHSSYEKEESIMEFVNMYGAGILHNEKSPAILSTMQSPIIQFVNVTKSAWHGISVVSAPKTMRIARSGIYSSMGTAFTSVSLTGESSQSDSNSFTPLQHIEIPYGIFGLVDICDTNKEIVVEERIVVYYKYDNFPVDCVKIFKSVYDQKAIGFRLLQFNLFNSSGKPWPPDYIQLIDGDIYNITTEEIATISMADVDAPSKFYKTSWPSLSLKFHATGATEYHGFVAEILTLPVSPHGLDRSVQHNITDCHFQNNTLGAVFYGSAGEISPTVTLEKNRFEDNCRAYYGNFSSCKAAVRFDVQNMQNIYIKNNVLRRNQGGIRIISDSSGTATSLKSYVHNNVFENNSNRETIFVEGKRSSPYQEFVFYRNVVTRNDANYRENIYLNQVVSNLTENYFSANRGLHTMQVIGFDRVRLPIYQSCTHNSFFQNVAIDWENQATIIAGSTGQQYVDNIFVNPANAYELSAVNKSMVKSLSQEPIRISAVDARHNWWGYKDDIPVMGRIRDENDQITLLRVLFLPYRTSNLTLLSGKCPPGYTLVADTCYIYIGGYMNYTEAKEFCRNENASMPYVESNYYNIIHFLRNQQEEYDYYDRIWVQDIDRFGECTVFVTNNVITEDCSYRLAFICETDPKVSIDSLAWTSDSVTIGALVAAILTLVLIAFFLVFCYTKSKQRKEERLERRNSVRVSMRSSRSFTSMGSLGESALRRRIELQKSLNTLNDYKKTGSIDSFEKSAFNSIDTSSSFDYDRSGIESQAISRPRPVVPPNINGLPPPPRRAAQPSYASDTTFQNQNYRDSPAAEFWDSPLQQNGKYVSNDFSRASVFTASTFPIQPDSSEDLTPVPVHPYQHQHQHQHPPLSLSYDNLDRNYNVPPAYSNGRGQPHGHGHGHGPSAHEPDDDNVVLKASKSQPLLQEDSPMTSFAPRVVENPPIKLKETSLDDLDALEIEEADYALDETTRPLSTYLETSVDDHSPPLRGAKSQYTVDDRGRDREHLDGFNPLSKGAPMSKSMPLETEM